MTGPRYAIYYAPPAGSPLARLGAAWLGRDVDSAGRVARPDVPGLRPARVARLTAAPRRYGFHATLKAPFHLAPCVSLDDLTWALRGLAESLAPVDLPGLRITRLSRFLALTPCGESTALQDLAAACVSRLDPFRAALSDQDLQRRQRTPLSQTQMHNLLRWGYPHVMEAFRFHMTLTGEIGRAEGDLLADFLTDYFGAELDKPLSLCAMSLFEQPERHKAFRRLAEFPLEGATLANGPVQEGASNAA